MQSRILATAAALVFLLAAHRSPALTLVPGDLVVVDEVTGVVVRVDPISGAQTLISDAGGGFDVAVDGNGTIWMTGGTNLLRVDPATGSQTVVASGLSEGQATGVSVALNGNIIVGSFGIGASVTSYDPNTGTATVLSDSAGSLNGVAVDAGGDIFVAPELGYEDVEDRLVRFDSTGAFERTYDLIGPPGQEFGRPEDIAFAPNGDLIILDGIRDVFVQLDVDSGAQTILDPLVFSSFPFGMAVEADGSIVFTAFEETPGSTAALWRFDPVTQTSSLITSGGYLSGGNGLRSVAVVPVPEPGTAALLFAGLLFMAGARRR